MLNIFRRTDRNVIEIIVTKIKYNDEAMDKLLEKYLPNRSAIKYCADMFLIRRKCLWMLGFLIQLIINRSDVKIDGFELKKYFYDFKVKKMRRGRELELKFRIKDLDISSIINNYVLPKIQENILTYEVLKIVNEELDEKTKLNIIKRICDKFNEMYIIQPYISKILENNEDFSKLELEFDELKIMIKN